MIKIGTLFTGIGAFEEALKQLKIDNEVIFASDNGERYLSPEQEEKIAKDQSIIESEYLKHGPNLIKKTYLKNFTAINWHEDVRFLDANIYKNEIDFLVGGSPCQAFSSMGNRKGFEDARGTLFYDYARIVHESNPKYFIYENVPGIKTIDKGKTWKKILEIFSDLSYSTTVLELNSVDFGLPQNRKRVFVVGIRNDLNRRGKPFTHKAKKPTDINKILDDNNKVDEKYFMSKKGFEFVTNEKYKNRATINRPILRTLKATQQYNWNGNFIFWETNKFIDHPKIYTGKYNGKIGVVRKMTPMELMRVMGFRKSYKLPKDTNDKILYRHSGNSIAVPILKEIIKYIFREVGYEEN